MFGSRMMNQGEARRGGMPVYKYVGNRILTTFENAVVGTELTEWHSGYRAYGVAALREAAVRAQLRRLRLRHPDHRAAPRGRASGSHEIPIPTYYGDEICYVDGMEYAKDVTKDVLRYRAHKMGFGTGEMAFATSAYELKEGAPTRRTGGSCGGSSLRQPIAGPRPRVLRRSSSARASCALGHEVTGVDFEEHKGVRERLDRVRPGRPRRRASPTGVGTTSTSCCAPTCSSTCADPERLLDERPSRPRVPAAA